MYIESRVIQCAFSKPSLVIHDIKRRESGILFISLPIGSLYKHA